MCPPNDYLFIYLFIQFCDVSQVTIIYKYIFIKFGNIQNIKVENLKHLFIL